MQEVFIIGSRGLPANYGGFETFVQALVSRQESSEIRYHVACLSDSEHRTHFTYKGADCFTIKAPNIGPARVIAYDMMAITYALELIQKEQIQQPIFYILGNTIGAFIGPFAKKIQKIGGKLYVNPDGLEWKRAKWSRPVQAYLKLSEKIMSKRADLLVADNKGIETYLKTTYPWSKTRFIAYGTDFSPSGLTADDARVRALFDKWQIKEKDYFLIVGRFVPENNYDIMIREYMQTQTKKDLVIICNHEGNAYFEKLDNLTHFKRDKRIKFVGTLYDRDLLTYIREQAFAYLHGHEVGGTNPGLLEALSQTDVNLVLGVDFNRTVADDTVLYWSKDEGNLTQLINHSEQEPALSELGIKAKQLMRENYSWERIVREYERLFLDES